MTERISLAKETKQILQENGIILNKNLGQNYLIDDFKRKKIIEYAKLTKEDTVLEIGPGIGTLTIELAKKAGKVIAIEQDTAIFNILKKRLEKEKIDNVELINGDAVKVYFPEFNKIVSNLPYQISSPIVFKLLSHRPLFRAAVLLIQREFAMRLIAKPGTEFYCRLSVNIQLLSKVDHIMKVSKKNFVPPPKVESSVVRIEPIHPLPKINFLEWDGMLRICFNRKNKTLGAIFNRKKYLNDISKL